MPRRSFRCAAAEECRALAKSCLNSSASLIKRTSGVSSGMTATLGGVEAQFWINGELLIGRRFDARALAVQWALLKRQALEKGGA